MGMLQLMFVMSQYVLLQIWSYNLLYFLFSYLLVFYTYFIKKTKENKLMEPQLNNSALRTFFLFINPSSGGNLGKQMLQNEVEKYQFRMGLKGEEDIKRIDAYMFNLKENRDQGFKILKQMNDKKQDTVAVVCGGDGTIMWIVSQFQKYKINPLYTPIAIIPLGTGNDFSRNLGWGGNPFFKWSTSQLRQFIRNWMEADVQEFDIWDSISAVFENGSFEKVSQQKDSILPQKVVKKTFCNYFSFGIDGQIGYNFDKLRTPSKFANFAVYGAIGAFNDLKNPITINQMLQNAYQTPIPQDEQNYKENGRLALHTQYKKIVLHGRQDSSEVSISEGQRNILALNIDSYTGGTTDIWKRAKVFQKNQYASPAKHSDGLIEFVSFDSGFGIAMQKSVGGFAKRIIQTGQPIRFNFKREDKSQHCTYLQIDGQFLRMRHPKYIIIRKSEMLGGKIRVLKRNTEKKIFNPFKDLQDLFK